MKNKKFPVIKFYRTDSFVTNKVALSNLTWGGTTAKAGNVNRKAKRHKTRKTSI